MLITGARLIPPAIRTKPFLACRSCVSCAIHEDAVTSFELSDLVGVNEKKLSPDIYSIRQTIKEGFILFLLRDYTTFTRYFKLVKTIPADDEYEKKKAIRLLTSDVDLSPHAIEQKSRIMLDHFLKKLFMPSRDAAGRCSLPVCVCTV